MHLIPSRTLKPYLAPQCMAGRRYLDSGFYDNFVDFSKHVKKMMVFMMLTYNVNHALQEMNKGLT